MEKAEDIQFHPLNTTYIFTAVKIQLFYIFTAVKYSFFKICIIFNQYFLYFITLYIMKRHLQIIPNQRKEPIKPGREDPISHPGLFCFSSLRPNKQLLSCLDGQFTYSHFFPVQS